MKQKLIAALATLAFILTFPMAAGVKAQTIKQVDPISPSPVTLSTQLSGSCAATSCTTINMGGYSSLWVQVTGTWSGVITIRLTIDGTIYDAVKVSPVADPTTPTATITGNGIYRVYGSVNAMRGRAEFTTKSSGSAVVSLRATMVDSAGGGGGGGGGGSAPAGTGSELQARLNGTTFQAFAGSSLDTAGGINTLIFSNTAGYGGQLQSRSLNGTLGSPTGVGNGNYLGDLLMEGYIAGAINDYRLGAQLHFQVAGTSGTSVPTDVSIIAFDDSLVSKTWTFDHLGDLTAPGDITTSGVLTVGSCTGCGGAPGGSNTQIQFNDGGAFGGDGGLTFDKTTQTFYAGAATAQIGIGGIDPDNTFVSLNVSASGGYAEFASYNFSASDVTEAHIRSGSVDGDTWIRLNANDTTYKNTISFSTPTYPDLLLLKDDGTVHISGLTYPTTSGVSGQVLSTNGSDTLTFVDRNPFDQQLNTINTGEFAGLLVAGLNYPGVDGSPNQVLTTDGAGNLSFTSAGGASGSDGAVQIAQSGAFASGGLSLNGPQLHLTGNISSVGVQVDGGFFSSITSTNATDRGTVLYGAEFSLTHTGAGSAGDLVGVQNFITAVTADSPVSSIKAVYNAVQISQIAAGSVASDYNVLALAGATIPDVYGVWISDSVDAATSIGALYGLRYEHDIIGAASITDMYGAWIGDVSSAADHPYAFWYNGDNNVTATAGVFRINGLGIAAYYNPAFAKYAPGSTNFERIILGQWNGNVAEIGTEQGGTGTLRPLKLIGSAIQTSTAFQLTTVHVADLPTCNGGAEGQLYEVDDALLPAALAIVANGGAQHVGVRCNATNWIVF